MTTQSIEGAMPPLPELLPCPFCGAGETSIFENGKMWLGMKYSEPSSVSVRHHCPQIDGQPSRMIERVGRDHASAVEAWNRRTLDAAPLLARVAELQADAARYRWLRDSAMLGTKHDPAVLIDGPSDCCEFAFGHDLDAAVDAARLKGNQA